MQQTILTQRPQLIVNDSKIHGTGCYAGRAFKKGEVVGEYTGEIISDAEACERYDGDDPHTYLFVLDNEDIIDASREPNPAKYMNHSCEPNCESLEKEGRIFIKAIKDIPENEELTYDYNLQLDEDDDDPCHCRCSAPKCRGTMKDMD